MTGAGTYLYCTIRTVSAGRSVWLREFRWLVSRMLVARKVRCHNTGAYVTSEVAKSIFCGSNETSLRSWFCFHASDCCLRVWRKPGEWHLQSCILSGNTDWIIGAKLLHLIRVIMLPLYQHEVDVLLEQDNGCPYFQRYSTCSTSNSNEFSSQHDCQTSSTLNGMGHIQLQYLLTSFNWCQMRGIKYFFMVFASCRFKCALVHSSELPPNKIYNELMWRKTMLIHPISSALSAIMIIYSNLTI